MRKGTVAASVRSAREVVEAYNLIAWNNRDLALAEELFADDVVRHDVGEARTLTRSQAVQRIVEHWEMFDKVCFDLNVVVAGDDGEHVAIVYGSSMELKDGSRIDIGSLEIFRVVDGRISEVWNCGHKQGVW
ncbi:MAG: nuclear transport factor 2 family protein, partial [Mycobacterium sp.]|uniref:nuclear transport factor 2 family protein n=1 Tax=Mycobacterium sp. TaxID=1785 RepID=UPI003C5DDE63